MNMSVADMENIYPFSENLSVNIANPEDIRKLKAIFAHKDLYLAVGSDVVENASAYRLEPTEDSIHAVNHIIFERETRENANWYTDAPGGKVKEKIAEQKIRGKILHLRLDKFFEDVSSTRIRENIDQNRDISALIDPVAQNFIYANNLYLREPAYKHVLEAREIGIGDFRPRTWNQLPHLPALARQVGANPVLLQKYLAWEAEDAGPESSPSMWIPGKEGNGWRLSEPCTRCPCRACSWNSRIPGGGTHPGGSLRAHRLSGLVLRQ